MAAPVPVERVLDPQQLRGELNEVLDALQYTAVLDRARLGGAVEWMSRLPAHLATIIEEVEKRLKQAAAKAAGSTNAQDQCERMWFLISSMLCHLDDRWSDHLLRKYAPPGADEKHAVHFAYLTYLAKMLPPGPTADELFFEIEEMGLLPQRVVDAMRRRCDCDVPPLLLAEFDQDVHFFLTLPKLALEGPTWACYEDRPITEADHQAALRGEHAGHLEAERLQFVQKVKADGGDVAEAARDAKVDIAAVKRETERELRQQKAAARRIKRENDKAVSQETTAMKRGHNLISSTPVIPKPEQKQEPAASPPSKRRRVAPTTKGGSKEDAIEL